MSHIKISDIKMSDIKVATGDVQAVVPSLPPYEPIIMIEEGDVAKNLVDDRRHWKNPKLILLL